MTDPLYPDLPASTEPLPKPAPPRPTLYMALGCWHGGPWCIPHALRGFWTDRDKLIARAQKLAPGWEHVTIVTIPGEAKP